MGQNHVAYHAYHCTTCIVCTGTGHGKFPAGWWVANVGLFRSDIILICCSIWIWGFCMWCCDLGVWIPGFVCVSWLSYAVSAWNWPGRSFTQWLLPRTILTKSLKVLVVTQSVCWVSLVTDLRSRYVGFAWPWLYIIVGYAAQSVRLVGLAMALRSCRLRSQGLPWSWLYIIVGYAAQSVRLVGLVVALRSCRLRSLFVGLAWSWFY